MLDDPLRVRVICNLIEHELLSQGYRVTLRDNTSITAVSPEKVRGKALWNQHRGWTVSREFKPFFDQAVAKAKTLLK